MEKIYNETLRKLEDSIKELEIEIDCHTSESFQ